MTELPAFVTDEHGYFTTSPRSPALLGELLETFERMVIESGVPFRD